MYAPNPDGGPMTTCTSARDAGGVEAGPPLFLDPIVRSVTIRTADAKPCVKLSAIE